ncbi:hypothetical protein RBU49_01765 [Clostridium sp. MB40-C1]|uniref:hypothetical protein n=1 Tax=Clostridium sp. MB40-C1 TaxID=3070996 RepID=UPI0027E14F51|nr:hypothetical protein [Clostridium sp. MB40-C1]WMJ81006.1 hypothetical protein RBU49_01765 [Clostridium sp. MB40-C1]
MKKLLIPISIIIFLICLLCFYRNHNKDLTRLCLNENSIKEISLAKLPVPPRKKVLSEKEDLKKIIDFVNSIKLMKKINQPFKGWVYLI